MTEMDRSDLAPAGGNQLLGLPTFQHRGLSVEDPNRYVSQCGESWFIDWLQLRTFILTGMMLPGHTLLHGLGAELEAPKVQHENGNPIPIMAESLVEAVKRELHPYRRPILSLTAGWDSRLSLAACLAAGEKPAIATWRDKRLHFDNIIARKIADHLGLDFVETDQRQLDLRLSDDDPVISATLGFGRHSFPHMRGHRLQLRDLGFDVEISGFGVECVLKNLYNDATLDKIVDKWHVQIEKGRRLFGNSVDEVPRKLYSTFQGETRHVDDKLGFAFFRMRSQLKWWPRRRFLRTLPPIVHLGFDEGFLNAGLHLRSDERKDNGAYKELIKLLYPKLLSFPFGGDHRVGGPRYYEKVLYKLGLLDHFRPYVPSDWRRIKVNKYHSLNGPERFRLHCCLEYFSRLEGMGADIVDMQLAQDLQ